MRKLLFIVLATLIIAALPGLGAPVRATGAGQAGSIAQPPFWDIYGHVAKPELTILGALGIYTGYTGLGGRADPDGLITPAQFAKVLVVATGKGGTVVPPWAWGYVNCAAFSVAVGLNGDETTPHTEADLLPGDWICVNLDDAGRAIRISAFRWALICEPAGGDFVPGHQDYVAGPVAKSSAGADTVIRFPADSPFSYRPFGTASHTSLAGVAVPIPTTAAVLINDEDAGRDDLQENDVLRVATFGALGLDPVDPEANPIIAVWATSTTVGGTIKAVGVEYPGRRRLVTLATPTGTREFERDPTYTDEPAVGEYRQYALDQKGRLFVEVTDPPTEIIVYVAGHTEDRTAERIRCYLGVDELGQDRGYEYDQPAMGEHSGLVGHFETLTVSAESGLVTAHADCDPDPTATVLAVGPDNCTLELADRTVVFASQPVVYRLLGGTPGAAPVYAGPGILAAGDEVRVASAGWRLIVVPGAGP